MEVVNPATEEVVARCLRRSIRRGRRRQRGPGGFQRAVGKLSARERGRLVSELADRLMERADEVARLETLHNGKPIFESRQIEIPAAAECFEYYAGWADKVMGETIPVKGNYLTYTLREPLGVVAAIVPWNFPLLLAAWKVAPALACGNTVMLKPASQTPLTALALGEIAIEVGLPPGVLNIVTGPGSSVGQAIVEHPGIDKIAFTGDTSTGKSIMRSAADTLKKITLELGGKSPISSLPTPISTPRCAARRPASSTARARSAPPGRGCSSTARSRASSWTSSLRASRRWSPAIRWIPRPVIGALASKKQIETVLRYVDIAQEEGARLIAGGERADIGTGKGYFFQPTVFDDVTPEMTIAREEIFGPVLAAIEFADVDEAIARANDSPYGLAAACGRATSKRRTMWRGACRPGRSGSTPTTSTTLPRRLVATRPAVSAVR